MEDDAAAREEGVPVAVHQHALHDWLGQVAGPGAGAAHLPRGTPLGWLLGGGASAAPRPHGTHPVGSLAATYAKQASPFLFAEK
uniref:Kidney associated antigen 1 n=1 Tax=Suricata suricatta TaxID=37032 RepID=A0A673U7B3_SURSU